MRAGLEKIVSRAEGIGVIPETVTVTSPAFTDGGRLPPRFTEDGAKTSPPLAWRDLPHGTKEVVLVVEDPDAPTPEPLVHALAWNLQDKGASLAEGDLETTAAKAAGIVLGRNSFLKAAYLPPDPPRGHGAHRYVFQLFALDTRVALDDGAGRSAVLKAIGGHVLARGMLTGLYERA